MNKKDQNNKSNIFYAITTLVLICIIGTITFIVVKELYTIKENMPINNTKIKEGTNNLITANVNVKIRT